MRLFNFDVASGIVCECSCCWYNFYLAYLAHAYEVQDTPFLEQWVSAVIEIHCAFLRLPSFQL